MILKSEIYHFHRLDLTRQAGFIVTIYDEDGLKLRCHGAARNSRRSFQRSAKDRGQQGRGAKKINFEWCRPPPPAATNCKPMSMYLIWNDHIPHALDSREFPHRRVHLPLIRRGGAA